MQMNTGLNTDQLTALQKVQLPDDWKFALADILLSPIMDNLRTFLQNQYIQGKTIYPPKSLIFNALNTTPLSSVKVVILGQDPYHGAGQAMGLSFSVPKIIPKPPSLSNILKELATDLGIFISTHGDLTHWANQGVLLLNATLTVEDGRAGSHQGKGWEEFTDAVIDVINHQTDRTVFILWGSYAKKKGVLLTPLAIWYWLPTIHLLYQQIVADFLVLVHFPKPMIILSDMARKRLIGRCHNDGVF